MKYRIEQNGRWKNIYSGGLQLVGTWEVVHDEPAVKVVVDAFCETQEQAQDIADALNWRETQ